MKQHQLTNDEINRLLSIEQVGRISTLNSNGFPYTIPVHFVFSNEKIYIHGLSKGQKITNIHASEKVCFEVDKMGAIIPGMKDSCGTNTEFESVVILGTATMVEEKEIKQKALKHIVEKYTPQLCHLEFPEKMLKATSIIEINILECTGKYYRDTK